MHEHYFEMQLPVSTARLVAVFGARPASWLGRFLRLAVDSASSAPLGRPWYRLDAPLPIADGSTRSSLRWYPHAGADEFTRFTGGFVVHPVPSGAILALEGSTLGGTNARNATALRSLHGLLGAAFSAGQGPDG